MYAKIEPHRARRVTYAMLRNYKKKTAELKKIAIKCETLIKYIIIIIIIITAPMNSGPNWATP